jgi:hypothetical protein
MDKRELSEEAAQLLLENNLPDLAVTRAIALLVLDLRKKETV